MLLRSTRPDGEKPDFVETQTDAVHDRAIGEIIRCAKDLTFDQVDLALTYQREHGVRFGDAAIAVGIAGPEDVMWALSQQFHYHYAPHLTNHLHEELVMANRPFSDEVEIFRDLRSHLKMTVLAPEEDRRAIAVVSSDIGDGKTFISANLAIAFSQLPGRTLIVDADMRSPRLHKVFGRENNAGLSTLLIGRSEANVIRPVTALPNLYMLPCGAEPPNPSELVQHPAFGLLMKELTSKFDYIVVDTPAAAHGSDARVIAAKCGAALVVGRKNKTRASNLQMLSAQLSKGPAKVAGVVMNEF